MIYCLLSWTDKRLTPSVILRQRMEHVEKNTTILQTFYNEKEPRVVRASSPFTEFHHIKQWTIQ